MEQSLPHRMGEAIRTIARLQEDHRQLRRDVAALEAALAVTPLEGSAVSEACLSLAKRLHEHTSREARLAVICSSRLGRYGAEVLARLAVDHHPDREFLQVIARGLRRGPPGACEGLRFACTGLVEGLRRRMEDQEAQLFPLLEHVKWSRTALVRRRGILNGKFSRVLLRWRGRLAAHGTRPMTAIPPAPADARSAPPGVPVG